MKRTRDCPASRLKSFEIWNCLDRDLRRELIKDICAGMKNSHKCIPSKYFYDTYGSRLFERICQTPEYYPTRTELSILSRRGAEIARFFSRRPGNLIELGSGSNKKVRKLLDAATPSQRHNIRYVPVDISQSALVKAAEELGRLYGDLDILGIVADFTRHMSIVPAGRKLILFLGGTIGNFGEHEARSMLQSIAAIMGNEDLFLMGIDLLKPVEALEAAYNDAQGITRDFNLNILSVINKELNADFDLRDFEHWAFFNPAKERIEMHLRARRACTVFISDLSMKVDFRESETIHTEICRKFSRESADRMFREAGLSVTRWLTDPKEWFALVELRLDERRRKPDRPLIPHRLPGLKCGRGCDAM